MAAISESAYHDGGFEDNPRDSLNFTPEKHYVAAVDAPKGGDPGGAKDGADQEQPTGANRSAQAHYGASLAVQGGSLKSQELAFTPSSGCFTEGASVGSLFEGAVRDSGGVRQGPQWTSEPAPGAHRALGVNHTLSLDSLRKPDEDPPAHMNAGRTFESQRHAHWVKD